LSNISVGFDQIKHASLKQHILVTSFPISIKLLFSARNVFSDGSGSFKTIQSTFSLKMKYSRKNKEEKKQANQRKSLTRIWNFGFRKRKTWPKPSRCQWHKNFVFVTV